MKKRISCLLLPCILLYSGLVASALYRGVDADGKVVYSDKPFETAEEYTPPPISVMDAPAARVEAKKAEEEKPAVFKYRQFDITSPGNNETVWNQPDLAVTVRLVPALNEEAGHTIWLLMDGKPVVRNSRQTTFRLGRFNRGAYQLQAQVRDDKGKVVVLSRSIVVHLKYGSAL